MCQIRAKIGFDLDDYWAVFPHENWPVAVIGDHGKLTVTEWKSFADVVATTPDSENGSALEICEATWLPKPEYEGVWKYLEGEPFVFAETQLGGSGLYGWSSWQTNVVDFTTVPLMQEYAFSEIRFLVGPESPSLPLLQEVWSPDQGGGLRINSQEFLETAAVDPTSLRPSDWIRMRARSWNPSRRILVPFPSPFDTAFSYGSKLMNANHPLAVFIAQIWARVSLAKESGEISGAEVGKIEDSIGRIFEHSLISDSSESIEQLWAIVRSADLVHDLSKPRIELTNSDYLPIYDDVRSRNREMLFRGWERPGSNNPINTNFGRPFSQP
jgi:hypothetical protein